jgi:hypothetical protein
VSSGPSGWRRQRRQRRPAAPRAAGAPRQPQLRGNASRPPSPHPNEGLLLCTRPVDKPLPPTPPADHPRYKARLDELEAAHAAARRAAAEARAGIARMNARNKTTNFEKALKNVGNRPDGEAGKEGGMDVFSRRQTQSKVYWQTKKKEPGEGGAPAAAAAPSPAATPEKAGPGGGGGAAATHRLSRTLSAMDPSELIPLLEIDLDLSLLPGAGGGGGGGGGAGGGGAAAAEAAAARRMLGGGRWQMSEAAQELAAAFAAAPRAVMPLSEWLAAANQQQQQQQAQ